MSTFQKSNVGQDTRLLQNDELDVVSGGIVIIGGTQTLGPLSRLVIYGFNPQPDPPGRLVGY